MAQNSMWKNIALWGVLTATALTGGCKDKPNNDQINSKTAIVTSDTGLEGNLTSSNQKLRGLPMEIPGAGNVEKYETPGAKYCLTHIRQKHLLRQDVPGLANKLDKFKQEYTAGGKDEVNTIQKNIYHILDYLKDNGLTDSVYVEGLTSELWKKLEENPRAFEIFMAPKNKNLEFEKNILDMKNLGKQLDLYEGECTQAEYDATLKELRDKEKEIRDFQEKYKFIQGGALRMVYENKLNPQFEDAEALKRANGGNCDPNNFNEYVLEGRENMILQNIYSGNQDFAVMSFGGGHSFRNNVEEWNKAHPENKFSLIVVTPENYKENN